MDVKASRIPISAALLALWSVGPWISPRVAGAQETESPVRTWVAEAGVQETGDQDADAAGSDRRRCRIRVTSEQSSGRKVFSATEILDLDFEVRLSRQAHGEHLLRLSVYTPAGHLYQTLTVPFSTDPRLAGARRPVEGFPRPLEVQTTRSVADGAGTAESVTARLPVAGTSIVHSSLYGRWTAQASLDDEPEACGRPRAFSLQP